MPETTKRPTSHERRTAPEAALPSDALGRPVHDLRVSLTDRCNLRCTYCMPAEVFGNDHAFLRKEELISLTELDRIIGAFVRCGVRKLRITGGEPLLRPGVVKFLERLRKFELLEDVAMTTNGLLLPSFAQRLAEAGLRRVTVSLDALDPAVFGAMNGRGKHPDLVLAGIAAARAAGLGVKVNMVVQRGMNDSQILPMARHFKEAGITLRFIEFMDVGNVNGWRPESVVGGRDILDLIGSEMPFEPVSPAYRGEVAGRFRYLDDQVEFGIITSVTSPFCGDCTRARLSADGRLFTCLFATQGHDLLGEIRARNPDDEELYGMIAGLWRARSDRYSELRALSASGEGPPKVEMSFIGG
ncbi:MAG: GTP 3',8-cyclase MoaA [Chthoniobacterales bacterium]